MNSDPNTPLTRAEVIALMTKQESPLALSQASIDGVEYDVFTHAPNDMRDFFNFSNTHFGDDEFLIYEDERWTFREVQRKSVALAKSLINLGINPGDRVAISMRNYPEYVLAVEAILAVGAVAGTLNSWWVSEENEYGITDSGARFAFVDHERWDRFVPSGYLLELGAAIARPLGELPEDVLLMADLFEPTEDEAFPSIKIHTDSDALIMYTSGSTGHPKGVVLTHRGIVSSMLNFACIGTIRVLQGENEEDREGVQRWLNGGAASMDDPIAARFPREKMLVNVPFFHVSGLHTMLFLSYRAGRTLVLTYKWNAEKALELIDRESLTRLDGVPTMLGEVLNLPNLDQYDLSSLVSIAGGGAARPSEHVKLLKERLPDVLLGIGYGMTETNAAGATNWGEEYFERPTSTGQATAPLIQIEIRDPNDNVLGPDQEGEICMKSALNMRCYWNKPDETSETLRDGWIYSGDLGYISDDGFLFITGRAKDIIIRGGENIACLEIENMLHLHPSVNEAAVHSAPDDRLGEIVYATILLRKDCSATIEDIQSHVKSHLAAFKVPSQVHFMDEQLPRIASGKVDKITLKKQAIERLREKEIQEK
jgi:acyl-CoA synthetase (AMP-forming)/AMP-acid ligase II